ncbi:MAG: OmpA family protein [Deltaproteobacteria bacterium]|nr:OmpA family protein [Deltaproteobacteria bacterium]
MNSQMKRGCFTGVLIFMLLFISAFPVNAKIVNKVDNFVIFLDQSGSMYLTHESLNEVNMILAKKVLLDMNDKIPELNYRCAVDLFAPWEEVLDPMSYNRLEVGGALNAVLDENDFFSRFTPMGDGIYSLNTVLDQMPGKTAVILVSDGKVNRGEDPVNVARNTHSKYPDVCFHVISLADNEKGEATLRQISQLGNCVYVKAGDLLKNEGMFDQFMKDVFYEDVEEPIVIVEETVEVVEEIVEVMPERIVLCGVRFDSNSPNIKPESMPVLDENVMLLRLHSEVHVVIEAHTDSMGSEDYNSMLSLKRAEAIYNYFVSQGISANRMEAVGRGETMPIADNSTAEGRAINRRVEIQIIQ